MKYGESKGSDQKPDGAASASGRNMQFDSLITFTFRGSTANAKSVLSVLGACVKSGDEIEVFCDGSDENEALSYIVKSIEDGLGE